MLDVFGADVALDWNRLQLDLTFRPDYVLKNIGVSSSMGSADLTAAMAASSGGQAVALDPALAGEVAGRLGDAAFTLRIEGTRTPPKAGETVALTVTPQHMHWFDASTGQRV